MFGGINALRLSFLDLLASMFRLPSKLQYTPRKDIAIALHTECSIAASGFGVLDTSFKPRN